MSTYTVNSPALSKAGLSAGQLNTLVAGTGLANLGQAFLDAETDYGLNALFILSHAAIESAWGTSQLATGRNALFGLNAYDTNPGAATGYATKADSVSGYASFMNSYYLHPGNMYYAGPTIGNIFVHYSTAGQAEATSIVGIMNYELGKVTGISAPAPVASAPAASGGNTYTVKSNDNMTNIAAAHGLTLAQLESYNPQISNFNVIQPGQVLNLGGSSAPAASSGGTYTVISQDTLSGIAGKFGLSLAALEAMNPQITNPNVIYPGEKVNVSGAATAAPAASTGTTATVASGDTLWALSQKYGTSVDQIVAWNKAKYPSITPNYIQAGWTLRVR